jgi:hypothetical protein
MGGEGVSAPQALDLAKELQPARRVGVSQAAQKEPSEQAGQHPYRYEEAGSTSHPALSVKRYPAARHDHMDMRMVGHRGAPAVEHRGRADAGAEMLGVGGDGE